MKIGIIAANNIRFSPYIFFYTKILDEMGIPYELVIPDRNDVEDAFNGVVHKLPWNRKQKTLLNYMAYSKAVHRLVKAQKYDGLIVLTTNNTAFCSLWLRKEFKGRYIVDIRDYTHENMKPFYELEKIGVRNSAMNVISSARFTSFLPKAKYYVCHNISTQKTNGAKVCKKRADKIVIGYIGAGGYKEQCSALMRLVSADERFELHVHAPKAFEDSLQPLAKELNCERICFFGPFTPPEKERIIMEADILFNAYGNGCPLLDCALSNKLYDALQYAKPILTSPDTYMTEVAGMLAFPIDFGTTYDLNALYDWYWSLPVEDMLAFAGEKLESVSRENEKTCVLIKENLTMFKR